MAPPIRQKQKAKLGPTGPQWFNLLAWSLILSPRPKSIVEPGAHFWLGPGYKGSTPKGSTFPGMPQGVPNWTPQIIWVPDFWVPGKAGLKFGAQFCDQIWPQIWVRNLVPNLAPKFGPSFGTPIWGPPNLGPTFGGPNCTHLGPRGRAHGRAGADGRPLGPKLDPIWDPKCGPQI